MPTTGARTDPYAQFNYVIEIDGIAAGAFSEVAGLDTEQDVIEYREGNEEPTVRKLPGLRKYPVITLKRGFAQDRSLWDWRKTVMNGRTVRRSGSIVLLNEAREEALRWNFREGWLSKLQGPPLNAKTSETAIESCEITHEGLDLQ
jgi:phage tail-like protein